MSADFQPNKWRWIAGAGVGVVVFAVAVAFLLSRGESASDVVVTPPSVGATPAQTPGPTQAPPPSQRPRPSESKPETEPPTEATEAPVRTRPPRSEAAATGPGSADAEAFAADNAPAARTALGDVTGDGVNEAVVASVRNNAVRIVVGRWNGSRFKRAFSDDGGPAQQVTALRVQDYNGQTGAEIVTEQRAGSQGRSISVWGAVADGIGRHEGHGGCWDGFHTFGISGVSIKPGRIVATCDGSPEPEDSWTSDVYEWRKRGWVYTTTRQPGD